MDCDTESAEFLRYSFLLRTSPVNRLTTGHRSSPTAWAGGCADSPEINLIFALIVLGMRQFGWMKHFSSDLLTTRRKSEWPSADIAVFQPWTQFPRFHSISKLSVGAAFLQLKRILHFQELTMRKLLWYVGSCFANFKAAPHQHQDNTLVVEWKFYLVDCMGLHLKIKSNQHFHADFAWCALERFYRNWRPLQTQKIQHSQI